MEEDGLRFQSVYIAGNGQERPCYSQPKREANLIVPQLTGKPHDNVLKDIRKILNEVEIDQLKFEGVYLGGNGQERPCYNLPRLECALVVSGYSTKYKLLIIDIWLVVPQPQITGKPHDNILKDIRRILEEVGIGELRFDFSYISEQNKSLICFKLPRCFVRKVAIKPIQANFGTITALDELLLGLAV